MEGQSYFVNFEKPRGTLSHVAELCYFDPTCVSFDWANDLGWLHRVTHDCASAVGASFVDGTDRGGSVYLELIPSVLAEKGINASECWRPAGQSDESFNRARLARAVFGTTAIVVAVSLVAVVSAYVVLRERRRRQQIAEIIDANAPLDDGQDGGEVRQARGNDEGDRAEDQLLAPA